MENINIEIDNLKEDFFLKNINIDYVFEIMERTDYLFIYNIKLCMKKSEIKNGVYLSELAEEMKMSVADTSKTVKNLEDKGYVSWKLDKKKEKTYIVLTNKALELGGSQKRKLMDAYEKIVTNIRKEDLEVTKLTLSKIRKLLE